MVLDLHHHTKMSPEERGAFLVLFFLFDLPPIKKYAASPSKRKLQSHLLAVRTVAWQPGDPNQP